VRYTSVVEILRHLRSGYGEKPSISAVCRGISLSYQPTYYHIKELEKLGVVATQRVGKQSPCELVNSPGAALWLGLICEADARTARGTAGALVSGLRPHLQHDYNALDCIVCVAAQSRIIAVSRQPAADAGRSLRRRCRTIAPEFESTLLDVDGFMEYLATAAGLQCVREAVVIAGHQQFWHYALRSGEGLGLVRAPGVARAAASSKAEG
jgi:hypothetical protein